MGRNQSFTLLQSASGIEAKLAAFAVQTRGQADSVAFFEADHGQGGVPVHVHGHDLAADHGHAHGHDNGWRF